MARYKNRKRRRGSRVMPPSTVWEWVYPDTISTGITFNQSQYSNEDIEFDILDYLEQSDVPPCSFPVYPGVTFFSTFVRTNISDFTQYAGFDAADIPVQLSDSCRLISQKGNYIGCDDGTANVSQLGVNTIIFGDRLKIQNILDLGDGTVLINFHVVNVRAQDIFTLFSNPMVQPFYPYSTSTTQIGGVPIVGDAYLNKGKIRIGGFRAHYIPGNKYTLNNPAPFEVDFTIL